MDTDGDQPLLYAIYILVKLTCGLAVCLFGIFLLFAFMWAPAAEINENEAFSWLTGWSPETFKIEKFANTFSDWPGDGECSILATTTPGNLESLMSGSDSQWELWPPDSKLLDSVSLPKFEGSHFRTEHVLTTDKDWHRGRIVMVNKSTGAISAYAWKR